MKCGAYDMFAFPTMEHFFSGSRFHASRVNLLRSVWMPKAQSSTDSGPWQLANVDSSMSSAIDTF